MKRIGGWIGALSLSVACGSAFAQSSGSWVVTPGVAWIDAGLSSFRNLTSTSAAGTFGSETTGQIHNLFTAEVLVDYFLTDHVSVEAALGIPPKLNMYEQGMAMPLGSAGPGIDLGKLRPLASARAWSPTIFVKYNFGSGASAFRPYLGVGLNYSRFSSVQLDPTFAGSVHAFAGPGGTVDASLSSSWNTAFTAGFSYRLANNWYALASASYIPLRADALVTARSAAGQQTLAVKTRLVGDPTLVFVGIGHRF
ncbi:OmpW family protein [Burkholderia cepacia]|uniref:OmpW/AlkL family protein n=1 Tax=Burkholderia cepacia TaxID=292 RepID=UPI00075BCB2D|nr:OmpW family outer membrane protein [Burkholderia cepacia]KVQ18861.1 OmpW family protein [Burkholderia cepacia]KVW15604.1 OmpW family protein [Burkholderia cepacia]KVZ97240.1 OmpW family protein [Burkholderia cepacia]KWH32256.1 OmpW family protein [Burkholderia cepacia]